MKSKTFSLVNLGCKVNKVEADSIGAALLAAGWQAVDSGADVAIVNTCTVTAEADRKTRKEVNRAVTRNPGASVLVTGCAAAIDPAAYEALSSAVRVVEKSAIVEECVRLAIQRNESSGDLFHSGIDRHPHALRVGDAFPTRVGVKVQDGCDNACTFCIVHVARGRARSAPAQQVLDEITAYARAGVREVVLTGIDLGAYKDGAHGLAGLIRQLRAAAPTVRLRISSIEPHTLDDALIDVLAIEEGMVCRHLHIPLQSGSSKVLHEMARHYSAEEYLDLVAKLREAVPAISLSTDVIVGFPGETEEDFAASMDAARACGFSRMHLFRYSKRKGTPAAERADQVAPEVKANRMERLDALAVQLRTNDAFGRLGAKERVLVESDGRGMSESYYEVCLPEAMQRGSLLDATLRSYDDKEGVFLL